VAQDFRGGFRQARETSGVELVVGVALLFTLGVVAVSTLRDVEYPARAPFVVGAVGCAAIYNAVRVGSDAVGWFVLPIVFVLAPLVPRALRRKEPPP
jgi:hypothetical protein